MGCRFDWEWGKTKERKGIEELKEGIGKVFETNGDFKRGDESEDSVSYDSSEGKIELCKDN